MEPEDRTHVVDLVAALDQATAALRDVAHLLGDYRAELVASGFSSDQALELCLDMQRAVIFGGRDHLGDAPYLD